MYSRESDEEKGGLGIGEYSPEGGKSRGWLLHGVSLGLSQA